MGCNLTGVYLNVNNEQSFQVQTRDLGDIGARLM